MINYTELDKITTYLSDKLIIAEREGYTTYSECVLKLAEGGVSVADIAEKFQMSKNGIRTHLHRMGFKFTGRLPTIPPATQEMIVLYDIFAVSYAEVGKRVGMSGPTARSRLLAAGIKPRKAGKPYNRLPGLKEKYIDERMSLSQIAGLYGVSIYKVSSQLKAEGVTLRAKGFHHRGKRMG